MNLPYSVESNDTGTAGDSVSVILSERLNSSTEYYYTVSAVSGDITVRVRGTFTMQDSEYIQWELPSWQLLDLDGMVLPIYDLHVCS